jgi:hypothetical protein
MYLADALPGQGKAMFEPKAWELNPPKPLPVTDPTTGWTKDSKRVGAIGMKLGMSTMWDTNYQMQPLSFILVICIVPFLRVLV